MDLEGNKFGMGRRELGGAVDLINQFKLWPHHEFFCKRTLPLSLSETNYLRNVVGDAEIRKGEGMELDQLLQNFSYLRQRDYSISTFDLDILREAFRMRDLTPIDLPSSEKGVPTAIKLNNESKDKEREQRKHRGTDHSRRNPRHKDKSNDENNTRSGHHDSGSEILKQQVDKVLPPFEATACLIFIFYSSSEETCFGFRLPVLLCISDVELFNIELYIFERKFQDETALIVLIVIFILYPFRRGGMM